MAFMYRCVISLACRVEMLSMIRFGKAVSTSKGFLDRSISIDEHAGPVEKGAASFKREGHSSEFVFHQGLFCDRNAELKPLARIGDGRGEGGFRNTHALSSDTQSRVIHQAQHGFEAIALGPDPEPFRVLKADRGRRGSMDPQFGFKPCHRNFISRTIGQGSGDDVQRQATGAALGLIEGIVIACEDEMDLGSPVGDVNLPT